MFFLLITRKYNWMLGGKNSTYYEIYNMKKIVDYLFYRIEIS